MGGSIFVKAGSGIKVGEVITCKFILSFKYNLFAGTAWWKKAEGNDKKIVCGKFEGGEVKYGDVEETGLPKDKPLTPIATIREIIELNGKKYQRIN